MNRRTTHTPTLSFGALPPTTVRMLRGLALALGLLLALLPQASQVFSAGECYPISSLQCNEIAVGLPYSLDFGPSTVGLVDTDGTGTGFTMVDVPSVRLAADVPLADANVTGYAPSLLDVDPALGTLTITATKGIQYRCNSNVLGCAANSSSNTNSQMNALGVGVLADSQTIELRTVVNSPNGTVSGAAQAGLWYGINEAEYVKLVVLSQGSGNVKVQLVSETNDGSGPANMPPELNTGNFAAPTSIELVMIIDRATGTTTGFYALNGSTTYTQVTQGSNTSLTASAAILAGNDHDSDALTPALGYAGIFATKRNVAQATPVTFTFDEFSISDLTAPAAPTGLNATAGDGENNLTWTANSEGDLAGYNLYRSTASPVAINGGNKVNTLLLTGTSYNDSGLTNGTPYFYALTAVDNSGNESVASAEATATPQDTIAPAAPTNLSATAGDGQVSLDWDDNGEADLAVYNVYRSESTPVSTAGAPLATVATSAYVDNTVVNGTTYYYVVTAEDTSDNESGASNEVTATPVGAPAVPCHPLSTLECDELAVTVPFSLTFDGTEGGILDGDGQGTGFTMIDPPGNTLADATNDGPDADVAGYIPSNLDVTGGNLTILTNKGISYVCPVGCTPTSANTNSQMNTLGVGLDLNPNSGVYNIVTTLPALPTPATTNQSQQAGIWFGVDEDNFVKLVVVRSAAGYNVELRREIGGASANNTTDQLLASSTGIVPGDTVTLRLQIDTDNNTIIGFYQEGAGAEVRVGGASASMALPAGYLTGLDHDANSGTPALTFAGVFATKRNQDANIPLSFSFSEFSITQPTPATPALVFSPDTVSFSIPAGGSTDSATTTLSTGDSTNAAFTIANVGSQPGWLVNFTLSGNTGAGGATIDVVVDAGSLTPGTYTHTLEATAPGYGPAQLTVELEVTSTSSFAVNVNFQSQWVGQTGNTPPASPTVLVPPAGYLADWGQPYGVRNSANQGGGVYTYGWVSKVDGTPISLDNLGRDRNVQADERLDTLIHMDHPAAANNRGYWEIAVPNGLYDVTVAVGDPNNTDSIHYIQAEGISEIVGFVPSGGAGSATRHQIATVTVTVADGKLTISDVGGTNTKINFVQIVSSTGGLPRPSVVTTNPNNGATNVPVGTGIATNLLYLPNGSLNNATLTTSTVYLYPTAGGDVPANRVPANVNGTGGGDAIILQPISPLAPNTNFTFKITDGVQDLAGAQMQPFTMTFTTGPSTPGGTSPIEFEKVNTNVTGRLYTSLTMGPDGRLYAATYDPNGGTNNGDSIFAWDVNTTTGALSNEQIITASIPALKDKSIIGLAFDPISTPTNMTLWVTVNEDGVSGAANFTGEIGRLISTDSGATWTYQTMIVQLPRSTRDHLTNSIAFNPGNPGERAFYFLQGSLSAMGAPDSSWGNRAETLLSAAALRVDIALLEAYVTANGPLNVNTGSDGLGNPTGGNYDPTAPGAPLTIFASGIRNAYDLVWHSNGQLYVPTNGSAAGGNTPGTPTTLPPQCANRIDGNAYTGPQVPLINGVSQTQPDPLFRVVQGGYYGHPNPTRCEWVMNGGNPTASDDPVQVNQYPVGTNPDPNWRGLAYNFANNKSPNGVIEYHSSTFGGALQGKLMVVRYSQGDDIIVLTPGGPNLDIIAGDTGYPGTTGFDDPLDLTEDTRNGFIYVAELGGQRITVLRPIVTDTTPPAAPTGLSATAGSGQVSLNWTPNSESDLSGYNLYRSTSPGVVVTLANRVNNTLIAATSFVDNTVTGGITYYYVVTAVDSSGNESPASNEDDATPTTGSSGNPNVRSVNPVNNATGIVRNTIVTAEVNLPNVGQGINEATIAGNVYLLPLGGNPATDQVPANINTSGGGDVIVLTPIGLLDANTTYQFVVTSGLQDMGGNAFDPFTSQFTTGTDDGSSGNTTISFERVNIDPTDPNNTGGLDTRGLGITSVQIGPDGRLYAATISGTIYRWDLLPDGTLTNQLAIDTVTNPATNDGLGAGLRTIIGLAFDPASTPSSPILWISHSPAFFVNNADWTGVISRLDGPTLGAMENYVVGLPHSVSDHQVNSIAFGPDGNLYILAGGNTSVGAPDSVWGNRPERLLSAAVLKLDMTLIEAYRTANAGAALDAKTEEGGTYNPFAVNAPLTLYATGLRNMYDLVWHTNGNLYVPANSAAAQGNTPSTPVILPTICNNRIDDAVFGDYTGPAVTGFNGLNFAPSDFLYRVLPGRYYGHPNPTRCEWVMNGGDPLAPLPTGWLEALRVPQYANGTLPDRNFDFSGVQFDFGSHKSPNGVIEYKNPVFGGALQGKLIVTRYSGNDDLVVLDPAAINGSTSAGAIFGITGFTGFADPLDITENTSNGFLYVAEFPQSNYNNSRIVLLRPVTTVPNIVVSPSQLVFQQVTSAGPTAAQTVRVDNLGPGPLVISSISLGGGDTSQFAISSTPSLPATVPAGSFVNIGVTFDATSNGPKHATLEIASNDPDTPVAVVRLDGLGVAGTGGANEPGLQWVLDTLGYGTNGGTTNGINVGDDNTATNIIHSTLFGQLLLGDEVFLPVFKKAGAGNVEIEVLSVYGPTSNNPTVSFGWYPENNTAGASTLFSVSNANGQSLLPPIVGGGSLSFDPGNQNFGIFSEWPAFANRRVYSQDQFNTWDTNIQHKVRVYALTLENGTVVPNAYVVATEEHTSGHDYQDVVVILRNVEPTEQSEARILVDNQLPLPTEERFVFVNIQGSTGAHLFQNQNVVRISNTGTEPLVISNVTVTGTDSCYFKLPAGLTLPLVINPGALSDAVIVSFNATGCTNNKSARTATLNIFSNDPTQPQTTLTLAGFNMTAPEGNNEPNMQQLVNLFGWDVVITYPGQSLANPPYREAVGEEVLSYYWTRFSPNQPITVTQIAAYHGCYDSVSMQLSPQGGGANYLSMSHAGNWCQSIMPRNSNSTTALSYNSFVQGTATPPMGANFAIVAAGRTSASTTQQAIRIWPLRDENGELIPHSYIVIQDYVTNYGAGGGGSANFDYNDNVYVITNVRPVTPQPNDPSNAAQWPGMPDLILDFDKAYPGTLLDGDGQTIGFTDTQRNSVNGNPPRYGDVSQPHLPPTTSYNPTALDIVTSGQGTLAVTSGAGINSAANSLVNGLCLPFDSDNIPFSVNATLLGPLPMDAANEQAGVMLGQNQQNYIKLVAQAGGSGARNFVFFREFNGTTATISTTPIPNYANIATLTLHLIGDPDAGTVTAAYEATYTDSTPDTGRVTLTVLNLPGSELGTYFVPRSNGCIIVSHTSSSTTVPFTVTYDRFAIESEVPFSLRAPLYRINVAGPSYIDGLNQIWTSDIGSGWFSPASAVAENAVGAPTAPIEYTNDDLLYQTYRGNVGSTTPRNVTYSLPIPAGITTVDLKLHFMEPYWGVPGGSGASQGGTYKRVFDVLAEGQLVLNDFDPTAATGSYRRAIVVPINNISVTDGVLTLTFSAEVDYAAIMAIEVLADPAGVNWPPSAFAGDDVTIAPSSTFTLSGVGSDIETAIADLDMSWTQTGGPGVTLNNCGLNTGNNRYECEFTAPATDAVLTFEFSVTDDGAPAETSTDSIIVSVGDTPISGLTVSCPDPSFAGVQTTCTASVTAGTDITYDWDFGDGTPDVLDGGASVSHIFANTGSYVVTVTASNGQGSVIATDTVNVITPTQVLYRINAGGPAFTDSDVPARSWSADATVASGGYRVSGNTSAAAGAPITNTNNPGNGTGTSNAQLYQTEAWGGGASAPALTYAFPVANGNYTVRLHFAETYFDGTPAGNRVMDILLEGQIALNDFDPKAAPNTLFGASVYTFTVTVNDGVLDLQGTASTDNAAIKGIEILNLSPTITPIANQTNFVGQSVSLPVSANDPELGALTFSATGLPDGLSINPTSGVISGTVTALVGNYNVTVSVTDGRTLASTSFTWEILASDLVVSCTSPVSVGLATDCTASIGGVTNAVYDWDFGDGTTVNDGGTDQSHAYATTGNKTVTVTVTFDGGSDSATTTVVVVANFPPTADAGSDQTVATGQTGVTLTGTATDVEDDFNSIPLTTEWQQTGGPAVTLSCNPDGDVCTFDAPATPTTLTFEFTATDSQNASTSDTMQVFVGDQPITGLNVVCTTPVFLGTATDCTVTTTGGSNITYDWDFAGTAVPNGGAAQSFVFATVGSKIVTVNASNAQGTVIDTATVEVLPAPGFTGIRINTGGPAFTDLEGRSWSADATVALGGYRVSGNTSTTTATVSNTNNPVSGTSNQQLYQTEAWGGGSGFPALTYAIPVPNGTYSVRLHFAETYWGAPGGGSAANFRVFDAILEGTTVLDDYNPKAVEGLQVAAAYTYIVTVNDGVLNINFTAITDNAAVKGIEVFNAPPALPNQPNRTDAEGQAVSFNVGATDPEGQPLTYSATGLPNGISINTSTGEISGTLGFDTAGVYNVTVSVTDGFHIVSDSFTWTVTNVNRSPVISTIGTLTVAEGGTLVVNITASDPDGDFVALAASGLPSFASFTPTGNGTGTLTLTPGFGDAGTYNTPSIIATDPITGFDEEVFTIVVTDTNRDPVLTAIGNQTMVEGATLTLNLSASDPDGQIPAFVGTDLPSFATLTDNGDGTATLAFAPGFTDAGIYTMTITVNDGQGGSDSETFTLTVTEGNLPPVLTDIADQTMLENTVLVVNITASDPDAGDTIMLAVANLPAFGVFVDNGDGTGTITFTPGFTDAGVYPNITVSATDALGESDSDTFTLTVGNVNRPPVLSAIGNQLVAEGSNTVLSLTAPDADGDTVTFSGSNLPGFATLTQTGPNSATLTLLPGFTDAGSYPNVVVSVDDGNTGTDSETFLITVTNVNRSPVLTAIGNQAMLEGATLVLNLTASDPDGDFPDFSITGLPAFGTFVDNGDGTATLTFNPGATDAGNYPMTVTVTDDLLATDSETFTLSVGNVNAPPELDTVADQTMDENTTLSLTINAVDPNGDTPLFFSTQNMPSFVTFSTTATSIALNFAPGFTDAGAYTNLTVLVNDGQGGSDSVSFNLTVNNVNRGPQVTNPGNQTNTETDSVSLQIVASDPDLQNVFYSATGLPAGLTIDVNTGLISGTIPVGAAGVYNVTVTVTDGDVPLNASTSFTWTVNELTGSITIAKTANFTGTFNFTGDLGSFSLDTGASQTFTDQSAGSFTITETQAATLFALQSVVCVDDDTSATLVTTVNLVAGSVTFDLNAGQNVTCTFTNAEVPQATVYSVYLPLVMTPVTAPDLVVESISADANGNVQIVIRNQGTAAVTDSFWVDLYVNPNPMPTGVNDVWNDGRSAQGAAWAVTAAGLSGLTPGGSLTLTIGDAFFRSDLSLYTAQTVGTTIVVQVDSASTTNPTVGGVNELHEILGGAYNNISSTTVSSAPLPQVWFSGGAATAANGDGAALPQRP